MSAKIVHLKESPSGTIVCGFEICPTGQRPLNEEEILSARFKHQYTVSHVSIAGGGHLQLSPKRTIAKNRTAPVEIFDVDKKDRFGNIREFFNDQIEEVVILLK